MPCLVCSLKLHLFSLTFFQVLADIAINPALFLPANRCGQLLMKYILAIILIFLLLTSYQIEARAQILFGEPKVKIRVKNKSRFLVTKLIILNTNFENIKSGETSDYVEVVPFYPSMKIDITILRNRAFRRDLWYHMVQSPIDNVGEKIITNEKNTIVINILKGEEKGQIDLDTYVIKE
jgi:hypothetical protein